MTKNLRSMSPNRVKITSVTMTGSKSAVVDYEDYKDDEKVGEGTAACFDVDIVEIDEENFLTGDSRLSATGEFIVVKRTFDRTGLGHRR